MKAISKRSRGLALAFLVTSMAAPSLAFAEDLGASGTVTELEINHTSADRYLQHHGRLVLTSGKASSEYKWGGTACGSRTLPDNMVAMLQRALESGSRITPRYQLGQGMSLCLVGFTVSL